MSFCFSSPCCKHLQELVFSTHTHPPRERKGLREIIGQLGWAEGVDHEMVRLQDLWRLDSLNGPV